MGPLKPKFLQGNVSRGCWQLVQQHNVPCGRIWPGPDEHDTLTRNSEGEMLPLTWSTSAYSHLLSWNLHQVHPSWRLYKDGCTVCAKCQGSKVSKVWLWKEAQHEGLFRQYLIKLTKWLKYFDVGLRTEWTTRVQSGECQGARGHILGRKWLPLCKRGWYLQVHYFPLLNNCFI